MQDLEDPKELEHLDYKYLSTIEGPMYLINKLRKAKSDADE